MSDRINISGYLYETCDCCGKPIPDDHPPLAPECPVRQLDAQSGYSETRRNGKPSDCAGNTWGGTFQTNRGPRGYTDAGGASRYFTVLEPDAPFYYVRKASRKERHAGCDMSEAREVGHNRFDHCTRCGGTIFQNPSRPSACKCEQPARRDNAVRGNHHACVKPLGLMSFLLALCASPGGLVLDPFMGSASTGVAAVRGGWRFVGIERDPAYFSIAVDRIRHALNEPPPDSEGAGGSDAAEAIEADDTGHGWVQCSFLDTQEEEYA